MTTVKIKTDKGVQVPFQGTSGACAFDLSANIKTSILIRPQQPAVLIPTGIYLDMTDTPGLGVFILPRSGLGHKKGLVLGNTIGLADNDYQGELFVSAWNRNPETLREGMGTKLSPPIEITPGMRLAQIAFINFAQVTFEKVDSFEKASDRGSDGFGSTGYDKKTA